MLLLMGMVNCMLYLMLLLPLVTGSVLLTSNSFEAWCKNSRMATIIYTIVKVSMITFLLIVLILSLWEVLSRALTSLMSGITLITRVVVSLPIALLLGLILALALVLISFTLT